MLRYIYTGEIEINAKNWVQLFGASIKLQLNELMVQFTKFPIRPFITADNWLEMLRIFNSAGAGDSYGKFLKEIFGYLREKSSELMNWPSFLQLTFHEVRLILNPESRVFKNVRDSQASLLTWIAHSKSHLISPGPLYIYNEDNWLEMLRIFNSTGIGDSCGKYTKEIFGFLREKSSELMNWPSFLQLNFVEVQLILNPESRIFKNSRDFQASLLTWLAHETNSKSHLISQLSACSFVELPEIIDLVEPEPAEDQSQENNSNGTESISEIESEDLDLEPLAKRTRLNCTLPQYQSPALSLLFCAGNHFYTYSFQEGKCVQLASLPMHDIDGFSMVLANDRLFMIGGHKINSRAFAYAMSKSVTSCSLTQLQQNNKRVDWKDEEELQEMANFSTLYVNGRIYTIGGLFNIRENGIFHKPLRSSYVLSAGEEEGNEGWKNAFCYNFSRSLCAVALLNDKLYIIGGIGINRNLRLKENVWERGPGRARLGTEVIAIDSVEVYNTTDEELGSVADLKLARFDHQAVVFQDKIFVIGGKVFQYGSIYEKDTDSVEVYDPNTNSWTNGPSLNVPRANFAAFVMEEKIFVLGGNLGKPTMEVYDPRKNKWSLEPCGDFPAKTNFSQFVIIK